jgi:hypothetical protein
MSNVNKRGYEGTEQEEAARKKHKSREEIKAWCSDYANFDAYKAHLLTQMRQSCSFEATDKKFLDVLARLKMACYDEKVFCKLHGHFYRWRLKFDELTINDGDQSGFPEVLTRFNKQVTKLDKVVTLPTGWYWMLEIYDGRRWFEWLYVKESNRQAASLGAFAARDFHKNTVLGFYCGENLFTSDVGAPKPSDDEYDVRDSDYLVTILNDKCQYILVGPKPLMNSSGNPMYLGMHFFNNACLGFRNGTKEFKRAARQQNTIIEEDGTVVCKKKVMKHEEFLTAYNYEDYHDDDKARVDPPSRK